jgi:hypothetical protein
MKKREKAENLINSEIDKGNSVEEHKQENNMEIIESDKHKIRDENEQVNMEVDVVERILDDMKDEKEKVLANAIMTLLRDQPIWDVHGRLIRSDGEVLYESDIGELIRHAVSTSKEIPQYASEFYEMLKKRNIPFELIQNTDGIRLMKHEKKSRKRRIDYDVNDENDDTPHNQIGRGESLQSRCGKKRKWMSVDEFELQRHKNQL